MKNQLPQQNAFYELEEELKLLSYVDSGAATSIITRALLDKLGYKINRPSKMIVITANGARTRSLGIVDNVPIAIGRIEILTSFQVLESKDEVLILGNDYRCQTKLLDKSQNSAETILKL